MTDRMHELATVMDAIENAQYEARMVGAFYAGCVEAGMPASLAGALTWHFYTGLDADVDIECALEQADGEGDGE